MKLLAIKFITVAITFITVVIMLITARITFITEEITCVTTEAPYGFPSNKFVNAWECTRYGKYLSGIMIVLEGLCPSGAIIIPSSYFP